MARSVVGVVGSRYYPGGRRLIRKFLDDLDPDVCVISDGEPGVGRMVLKEAELRGHPIGVVHTPAKPKWSTPRQRRFHQLAIEADRIVVLWDGWSAGAKAMIRVARVAGTPLTVFGLMNSFLLPICVVF